MSGDPRAILTAAFEGLSRSDSGAFLAALSDEVVWRVSGSTAWSGAYHGLADIRERLFQPLRARAPVLRSVPERIIVDGDWAAVQFHGDNQTVDGQRYDNRYVFIIRFAAGRIVEVTEYLDTELATRVLGSRPAPDAGQAKSR